MKKSESLMAGSMTPRSALLIAWTAAREVECRWNKCSAVATVRMS